MRIALVTCVKTKRPSASPAGDLYTSPFFLKLRQYALANADAWYILSAKYGLLRPDQVVEPYERTLKTMSMAERLAWREGVQSQLLEVLPARAEVVMLAGLPYRMHLVPFLEQHGFSVTVPFDDLPIGRWMQRLNELRASRDGG